MVIAIDGPAGSGKSTIAKMIAKGFGFVYVNSGNIYRAMALRSIWMGIGLDSPVSILACAQEASICYNRNRLYLDDKDVEDELHSPLVDARVSQVSAIPALRSVVNDIVRKLAGTTDAVVEGRDMTTVVFPDAEAKFFLDASPEVRASRRFADLANTASFEEIQGNIEMRDKIDRSKSVGALRIAEDAEYLDSSHLTIQEVYDKVYAKILQLREPYGR